MKHHFRLTTLLLATAGLLSCDHSGTGPRRDQLTLDVVSGDGQTAVAGTQLAPLIVKVANGGNPVTGQVLNFVVVSGGGSVYGGTELTDSHGIAQELWTLGTNASQPQKVEVRAVDTNTGAQKVFATFVATALAGPASQIKVSAGDQQTAAVSAPVSILPAVLVADQYGNPVAGIAIAFAVASGGGSVTGPSATSGVNGIATVGSWTLGPTAGTNTLTATRAGLAGSPLTFTATASGPAGLTITNHAGDGQSQPESSTLPVAPAVQVTDQNGHPVSGVTITFSVTAGGGSITGQTQITDVTGIATVGSWTLGPAAGVNELEATFNTGPSRGATIFVATGFGNFWTTLASMPTARNDLTAGALNGLVYAIAGKTGNTCTGLTTVEAFDPTSNSWATKAALPTGRFNPAAATVGATLYVVGGDLGCGVRSNELDGYNSTTNSWTVLASMPTARTSAVAGVAGGILYMAGGVAGNNAVATLEAYNPSTNVWTTKQPMNAAISQGAGGVVNGVMYVVGQQTSGLMMTQAYNPGTDTWTTKTPPPDSRHNFAAGVANGTLYLVGGFDATGTPMSIVDAYNPATDTWTTVAQTPTPRTRLAVTVANGVLYAVGGGDDPSVVGTNQAYHP